MSRTPQQRPPVKVEPTTVADEAARKRAEAAAAAPDKAKAVEQKSEIATAVNLIIQTDDDGNPVEIVPGTVFRPAEVDMGFLIAQEAIREPTEAERVLFERDEERRTSASSTDETLG